MSNSGSASEDVISASPVKRRKLLSLPPELPAEEYYRQLEVGLSTLRDQCAARDENDIDAELGARFVELFELWQWGSPVDPAAVSPTQDKRRRFPVGKIARICTALLQRLAEAKREEFGRVAPGAAACGRGSHDGSIER